MRQVIQGGRERGVVVEDVPDPEVRPNTIVVRTTRSLISSGTERAVVETGRAGYIGRARQQPERVRKAMDKLRTDGLGPTVELVRSQTERVFALGYSSTGVCVAAGPGVTGVGVGDVVACNGPHAELAVVPANLSAVVPDGVPPDAASFTVVGAIAMQGIRLVAPTLGETVGVIGLGLVGQLAIQLLDAHGVRAIGFDTDPARVALARSAGIEAHDSTAVDPVSTAFASTHERGADAVIVAASGTSDEIVHQAAAMCRQRGRVVVIGAVGLGLRRADFYAKELTFQISASYGPGRYDPAYEDEGVDYPLPFVRWTAQRNFEAVLDAMARGRLQVEHLISDRFAVENAADAYETLVAGTGLATVLVYPDPPAGPPPAADRPTTPRVARRPLGERGQAIAMIGAGGYARGVLAPALASTGTEVKYVASRSGLSAATLARSLPGSTAISGVDQVLDDDSVGGVIIATRHDSHARLAALCLENGLHTYVEKPLGLTMDDLRLVDQGRSAVQPPPELMVGFNRRFAPLIDRARALLEGRRRPASLILTCNAGKAPRGSWVHDGQVGGGRLLGEACHFVDLVIDLMGVEPKGLTAHAVPDATDADALDTASITLTFSDGSVAVVNYFAHGSTRYPKERLEVFCDGQIGLVDNFRTWRQYGPRRTRTTRLRRQDKGNHRAVELFVDLVAGRAQEVMPYDGIMTSSLATLAVLRSIENGETVDLLALPHELRP